MAFYKGWTCLGTKKTDTHDQFFSWWLLPDSNWGHVDLQSTALPTELKSRGKRFIYNTGAGDSLQGVKPA